VKAESGITVRLGVCCDELEESARGTTLIDAATGERHGPHDVVIVCNGARSSLRDDTAHHKSVIKYPWGALWAVLPDVDSRYRGVLRQVVNGTRRLIGLLPTGRGPSGDERLVSFFFSLRSDRLADFQSGDFTRWKASVIRDVPESAPVVRQLTDANDLLFSEYHDVVMWPWNAGRVVYLGDAAHATSPQLGQGCNLALLDAWVLSQCFMQRESVHDVLFAYSAARRTHLRWYQFITRWLTPFFQSDWHALGLLRDAVFGPSTSIPFVKRQMVEAMAGISRGPLSKPLALPR
jgi:2-polyprenyl-6-methoxyphenol hydroxylase-like FAD-dependent oxidoreductase